MQIRFKKLHPNAVTPKRATDGAAGFDLTAVSVKYGENGKVFYDTGIAVEIPAGYVGLVFQRSSVHKTGLMLCNAVGVIDADYRGSISFVFRVGYGGCSPYNAGDRIGQIVFVPVPAVELVEADELSETARGAGFVQGDFSRINQKRKGQEDERTGFCLCLSVVWAGTRSQRSSKTHEKATAALP